MKIFVFLYFPLILFSVLACERINGLGAKPEARFIKLFGGEYAQEGVALAELPEGKGFALLGTSTTYSKGVHKDLYFVLTDESGNWTRQERYNICTDSDPLPKDDHAAEILQTDMGFLLVGSTSIGNDTSAGSLIFLNWKGDIVERQCLFGKGNQSFKGALRTAAGDYIFLGHTDWVSLPRRTADSTDFLIYKYPPGKNGAWNPSFGFEGVDEMVDAVEVDNELYCLGTTYTEDLVSKDYINKDYYLAKLDSDGNRLLEKRINPTRDREKDDLATQLLYKASESSLYIIGTTSIVVLDKNFINQDLHKLPDQTFAKSAQLLEDGGLLVVGEVQEDQDSDIWLAKYDKNLDLIWEKRFGGGEKDQGSDLLVLADGSIVILGTIGFGKTPMMALIKTDEEGNL